MKKSSGMFSAALVMALVSASSSGSAAIPTEPSELAAEFNRNDLAGPEELTAEESDGLAPEERELFYRARTSGQLSLHGKKRVQIVVNKSMKERGYQYVTVSVDGSIQYDAPVSTAWERMAKAKTRTYYAYTPVGQFFPDGIQLERYSNTWKVMLKHVIRFSGGVWIHATTPDHFAELGAPASGGCVRLYPEDAKEIYEIITKYGMNETAITVLSAQASEKQIPWTQSKLPMPQPLLDWRDIRKIR